MTVPLTQAINYLDIKMVTSITVLLAIQGSWQMPWLDEIYDFVHLFPFVTADPMCYNTKLVIILKYFNIQPVKEQKTQSLETKLVLERFRKPVFTPYKS